MLVFLSSVILQTFTNELMGVQIIVIALDCVVSKFKSHVSHHSMYTLFNFILSNLVIQKQMIQSNKRGYCFLILYIYMSVQCGITVSDNYMDSKWQSRLM